MPAIRKLSAVPRLPVADGTPCIYAIKTGELVRIGRSNCLSKRLSFIRADSPEEAVLYGAVAAQAWMERGLHLLLREHWVRGQWFRWTREVIEVANLIRDQKSSEISGLAMKYRYL